MLKGQQGIDTQHSSSNAKTVTILSWADFLAKIHNEWEILYKFKRKEEKKKIIEKNHMITPPNIH
jgi:hypothetical protein